MSIFLGTSMKDKVLMGAFAAGAMALTSFDGNILGTVLPGAIAIENLADAAIDIYRSFTPGSKTHWPSP